MQQHNFQFQYETVTHSKFGILQSTSNSNNKNTAQGSFKYQLAVHNVL